MDVLCIGENNMQQASCLSQRGEKAFDLLDPKLAETASVDMHAGHTVTLCANMLIGSYDYNLCSVA